MSDDSIPYVYCFVRTDIPIADQIVQVGHACIEAGKRFQHPDNTHLVLLNMPNQDKLVDTVGFL